MDKKYIILITCIVLIVILVFLLAPYLQDPFKKCVKQTKKELKERQTRYLGGGIIANFRDGTPKEEMNEIAGIYGFNVSYRFPSSNSALLNVPKDLEIESMCRLGNDSRIMSAELNVIFSKI